MLKKNLLVFPILIALTTNVTGQAFKGYGGYMVGLWTIDWSTMNTQISEAATDFGMGKFDQTLMLKNESFSDSFCSRTSVSGCLYLGVASFLLLLLLPPPQP